MTSISEKNFIKKKRGKRVQEGGLGQNTKNKQRTNRKNIKLKNRKQLTMGS